MKKRKTTFENLQATALSATRRVHEEAAANGEKVPVLREGEVIWVEPYLHVSANEVPNRPADAKGHEAPPAISADKLADLIKE